MAAPIAMVGIASTLIGAMTSAAGAQYQGQAQSNMYTYQAGLADMNAKIAKQNAEYAGKVGEVEAQQSGEKTAAQIATTKAIQGASGLDVDRGSPVDIRTSEREIGQENEGIIRANAARKAYGFEVDAANQEAQSNMYKTSASTASTTGKIGFMGSILGGAASVSSKWLQGSSVGLWT